MPPKTPSFYPLQGLSATDEDLSDARTAGIEQEIELMRTVLRRIRQYAVRNADSPDPVVSLDVLRSAALASIVLGQLLRTRQLINAAGPTPQQRYDRFMAGLREYNRQKEEKTTDQTYPPALPETGREPMPPAAKPAEGEPVEAS